MGYKLFTLHEGEITINRIEILTVPSFKTILRRDKGSVGDSDGRRKLYAFKEFAYIYNIADYNSVPNRNGFNYNEAKKYAIDKAGLPSNYKPDEVVRKAINDYKEAQTSVAKTTMLELIKTYKFLGGVFNKIRKNIENKLVDDELTSEQAADVLTLINLVIEQGKALPELTNKLNKAIRELEVADEKENRDLLRGTDEVVPDSANPDMQLN